MFTAPIEEQYRQLIRQDYEALHRSSTLAAAWSMVSGGRRHLLHLGGIETEGQVQNRNHVGIQTVPIDGIRGSESRPKDFDPNWRPLKYANHERWMSIAMAHQLGRSLPAVDLIKVGDAYYVRDGHHRVSVAKYQGQEEMEANVIEWHMAPQADSLNANSKTTDQPSAVSSKSESIRRRWNDSISSVVARAEMLQRSAASMMTRLFNRPQNPFKSGSAA